MRGAHSHILRRPHGIRSPFAGRSSSHLTPTDLSCLPCSLSTGSFFYDITGGVRAPPKWFPLIPASWWTEGAPTKARGPKSQRLHRIGEWGESNALQFGTKRQLNACHVGVAGNPTGGRLLCRQLGAPPKWFQNSFATVQWKVR